MMVFTHISVYTSKMLLGLITEKIYQKTKSPSPSMNYYIFIANKG